MTDELDKGNDGRLTVSFKLAREPLSPAEQVEFIQDLATLLGVPTEEISFIRQYEAPRENGATDPANNAGSLNGAQIIVGPWRPSVKLP